MRKQLIKNTSVKLPRGSRSKPTSNHPSLVENPPPDDYITRVLKHWYFETNRLELSGEEDKKMRKEDSRSHERRRCDAIVMLRWKVAG
jgi:hypothetical protein